MQCHFGTKLTRAILKISPLVAPRDQVVFLETKWRIIKHDVAKFHGVYRSVNLCKEFRSSLDDIFK